jgi:hypothetical protein
MQDPILRNLRGQSLRKLGQFESAGVSGNRRQSQALLLLLESPPPGLPPTPLDWSRPERNKGRIEISEAPAEPARTPIEQQST